MQILTNIKDSTRKSTVGSLAVVGFIALIGAGIWLAVYSARFVPAAVNRLGAAAVDIASIFHSASNNNLAVVSIATTTNNGATITNAITGASPSTTTASAATPTAGKETATTTVVNGTTTVFTGLPDLVVKIVSTGYLATTSPTSFVASSTVPVGSRPAIHFIIKNIGTNVSGTWRFSATIPTRTAYVYQSISQQSLEPGDSIEYTLGFDQALTGTQPITITANFDHSVKESSIANDTATTTITVLGS